jgi:GNAT superfamily N-acetyltransferase
MDIRIRPLAPEDLNACGRIQYEAFKEVSDRHRFPAPFPSVRAAVRVIQTYFRQPSQLYLVAEVEGRPAGACVMDREGTIRGVRSIAVDPERQGTGVGRRLVEGVLERCRDAAGVRLTQDAFNLVSMSLYASLGFEVREPVVKMEGRLRGRAPAGGKVGLLKSRDVEACQELCLRVHGIERNLELIDGLEFGTALAVRRDGRVTGYASAVSPAGHGLAETLEDLELLISHAQSKTREPLSLLIPIRQAGLFRWCLEQGLKAVKPMTLMARGLYQEPRGWHWVSGRY